MTIVLSTPPKEIRIGICIEAGFPSGSDSKESASNARDPGLIPELGRSPGKWNGYPLQYSCLENSIDRGAWWTTVHGVTKSWTQYRGLKILTEILIGHDKYQDLYRAMNLE